MKMKFLSMVALAAVVAFSSCGKEDPAEEVKFEATGELSATVAGKLLYNPDITKVAADQKYAAMANAKVIASIPYAELTGDATATGSWMVSVTTNTAGEFSVSVPANATGVTVSFSVSDIKGEQKQKVGSDDKTLPGVWSFAPANETVKSGQGIIQDFTAGTFVVDKADGSLVN